MDKDNTTLADLAVLTPIRLCPMDMPPIWTTPGELMRDGRFPAFLTIAQVEFALSPHDKAGPAHAWPLDPPAASREFVAADTPNAPDIRADERLLPSSNPDLAEKIDRVETVMRR